MKENIANEFTNLTTKEITTNINNLKIQLAHYKKQIINLFKIKQW
ncbi:hypothetical protein [Spiroplasma endosymbiont of Polydrusus formosus]